MSEFDLDAIRGELCPSGVLRAAINMTNGLLVTGTSASGDPEGVSPDMAAAVAAALSVPVELKPYPGPGYLADALAENAWDIGNIAAEPERAKTICFSPAYCEIQATYLVHESSSFQTVDDVDSAGVRISAKSRAAYELWLSDNLQRATLVTSDSFETSSDKFFRDHLEALAGLRPALLKEQARLPGTRILQQRFTSVQQCIGCRHGMPAASQWLNDFVD